MTDTIETPMEPFVTQIEYGVVLDSIGSIQTFDTESEAREYSVEYSPDETPLQVVKITVEPIQ
jgi:hypothetical protein